MNKSIKNNAVRSSLLALALAATTLPLWGQAPAAKSPASAPRIAPDATAALYYVKNTSPALDPFVGAYKKIGTGVVNSSGSSEDQKEFETFLSDSGLRDADYRWVVFSLRCDPATLADRFMEGDWAAVGGTYALSFKHDIDRIVSTFRALPEASQHVQFVETEVSGVRAWRYVCTELPPGATFYVASLGGEILVGAVSRELLAREIDLYRGMGRENKAFAKIVSGKSAFAGLYVANAGQALRALDEADSRMLAGLDGMIPNGREIAFGAKALAVRLTAGKGGAKLTATLALKDDADANAVKAVVDTGLGALRAQIDAAPIEREKDKILAECIKGIVFKVDKNTLVLSVPLSSAFIAGTMGEVSKSGLLPFQH